MYRSRRQFISSSIRFAGACLITPAVLGSCKLRKKGGKLSIDFIGSSEAFEYYRPHFRKSRTDSLKIVTLENALIDSSDIVFIDSHPSTRAAYMLMLMEQGKHIITTYPFAGSLEAYAEISQFMHTYGRIVGLINPLVFYPSFLELRDLIEGNNTVIEKVEINCNPETLDGGMVIGGASGTAQPLVHALSFISGRYALDHEPEFDASGVLSGMISYFDGFEARIRFDDLHTGWNMAISGGEFSARCDHTGMLAIRNEPKPRLQADPDVMRKAITDNVDNYLDAVEEREEPVVGHVEGLSSIILNDKAGSQ